MWPDVRQHITERFPGLIKQIERVVANHKASEDSQAQTNSAQAAEIERLLKALNEIDDIFGACDDQQDAYAELARCGRIASKAIMQAREAPQPQEAAK